jgi:hydroxymethylpyrimidine/phosphomethylpyrimidine kinase
VPTAKELPVAVTIAGSDSGGGAGIQADLKTFNDLGVHGTTVVTCITAQQPKAVSGIEACSPGIVQRQLEAVFDGFAPGAAKTGMLYSEEIVRVVARFFERHRLPLIVDPVMVATSGARLLKVSAVKVLINELLPVASLIAPNVPEAEVLVRKKIRSVGELRAAARELHERFGCAVLAKGGHLRGLKVAVDIFVDGKEEMLLSAPFVTKVRTHGTGCRYSAAVAAFLARGWLLPQAVQRAKGYITEVISRTRNTRPAKR